MSRIRRLRRRAGHSASTHDRARRLSAVHLDEPLEPSDSTWLAEHLASCAPCRSVASAYAADRTALRGLRDRQPEAPRDLWARTAASLQRESVSSGRVRRRSSAPPRRTSIPGFGALAGVAAVALVVGATVLSGNPAGGPQIPVASGGGSQLAIAPTPTVPGPTTIAVGAGWVNWIEKAADGALAYNTTQVLEVCPPDRQPDCAPVAPVDPQRVNLTIRPKSVTKSPGRNQAVVVGTDASGRDAVVVIVLPTTEPSPAPTKRPTPTPTPPETTVPATETPGSTTTDTTPPPDPATTSEPSDEPPPATPTPTAVATPEPTVALSLAIVSDVTVVGQSAAYSPDGSWFAFSARPADDSAGPDVYLWRVGSSEAKPMTDDHASVFASWVGNRLVASRTMDDGSTASFFIDPVSAIETPIEGRAWRPIVDPTGRWAVTWVGTVKPGSTERTAIPDVGSLVLRAFDRTLGFDPDTSTSEPVAKGQFGEFDVRWDETGRWLAVWLADPTDPTIGRLNLLRLDPDTGQLDRPRGAPQDVTSLAGFSISNGRLVWATPPGQGGEGSRVQIVAWSGGSVGAVESGPVEDVIVVN